MTDRTLASIVKVKKLIPIADADKIELAEIKGWRCIVKKNEFSEEDLGVYFSIDSVVDISDPNFEFLKGKSRIKTIKMRGVISQGLLLPLNVLSSRGYNIDDFKEGDDVTTQMNVTKYISTEELSQYENSNGTKISFPNFVPKTDETRIQDTPEFLNCIKNRNIVITRKEDGCSCTFIFKDGMFYCCGRNYVLTEPNNQTAHYFHIKDKFNMEEKMNKFEKNIAIQGEIVGCKINGNRLKLTYYDYRVFNIYDIDNHKYLNWESVEEICNKLKLNTVPVVYKGCSNKIELTTDAFLKLANDQSYGEKLIAEGIVVKTNDENYRISFKVISNEYLLKHGR